MKTQQHDADASPARLRARSAGPGVATREPGAIRHGEREAWHPPHPSAPQLEAVFASMADGVIFTDGAGRFVEMNAAARRLLALDARPDFTSLLFAEQARFLHVRDALGHPIPVEQVISWGERVLAGETLGGTEVGALIVRALDGRDVVLGVTAAPVREAGGAARGVVWVVRDMTELRRQGQRTHDALAALVTMAELLVSGGPPEANAAPSAGPPPHAHRAAASANGARNRAASSGVAQQLAQLARTVMGCRLLDMVADEPPGSGLRLVASSGLSAREAMRWRTQHPGHGQSLLDLVNRLPPDLAARFERGESIFVDHMRPEFASLPSPFPAHSALVTPMRLGGHLIGFLALDYGPVAHAFTPDEIALAAGTARLVALVLERHRLLCEREEARANALALRETNRRMDEFLAVATHELRGPVQAGLLGMGLAAQRAQRLTERVSAREGDLAGQLAELQKDVVQAEESVDRLARLIADLLDVSRIQAGQLKLRLQPADLASIVSEAVARQRLLAPERVIQLRLPRALPVPALADPDRIGQVVANLLGNAVRYSPEGRQVEVRVQLRGGRARVAVIDEGPGLPVEEQRLVWERYYQAPGIKANPGTSAGLGVGLRLSIVREIVRAHGGRIGVRSSPGHGATFWFTLPLDRERAP
jgi:signal transduction histidine kinase/PAS domain-containing protein